MNMARLNAETGTNPRQIRYLIVNGLMPPPTGGRTYAKYGEEHIAAVRRYKRLRALGLGLDEIKKIGTTLFDHASEGDLSSRKDSHALLGQLARNSRSLAVRATERLTIERPLVKGRYGEIGMEKCVDDICWHIAHLRTAAIFGSSTLFNSYVNWVKSVFKGLGIDYADFLLSLSALRDVFNQGLDCEESVVILPILENAIRCFPEIDIEPKQFVDHTLPHGAFAQLYLDALLSGSCQAAVSAAQDMIRSGLQIAELYVHVIQPAMRQVGLLWENRQINVAHEHVATSITTEVLANLPYNSCASDHNKPVMVAACAAGELHDIGLRMVVDIHKRAGWRVIYLGPNTPAAAIASAAEEHRATLLMLSATITPHLDHIAKTITLTRANTTTHNAHIIVGGAPFNIVPSLWKHIGADGTAADAETALSLSNQISGSGRPCSDRSANSL